MRRVTIGEFRDRAGELIRRGGGETIVILHRDREVPKVVPIYSGGGASRDSSAALLARRTFVDLTFVTSDIGIRKSGAVRTLW